MIMDNKDLEKYLIEIGKTPLLSIEEEIELAKAVQQKGADCDEMKKLTKHNERFVVSVARQYQNKGLSLEELLKAGRAGLEKAALKFDATRGFKFVAFAVWWVRREILIAIGSPDVDVINPIQNPAILQELCNNGSKSAALKLGQMYDKGDEENGIFRNPVKARRYFKLAGKKYEYEPEEENPHEADYFLRGSAEELAAVKTLVDELTQKYGDAFNEFGLYIPMNILMKTLVGSRYYDGNLLTMNTDDPECIVLHAEANTMEPLLYALRQAFPNLKIEMKETKLR
jgi:RNA polymerase sigma factor (sigma-70 family)